MPSTRGRQVVIPLTNKSGAAVAAGDVVVFDTTTDESFTTTTTGRAELSVGVAQETIASNAVGRVLVSGYAGLVNVPASVTRGHYIETHTVVKQATGSATRRSGSLGQFAKTSTTPSAWIWGQTDQTASGGLADQGTATFLDFTTAAAPANPAAGKIRVYSKTGDTFSQRTSGGTETVFGAGGSGALVLLEQYTASASATLDFTTFISATYAEYLFEIVNLMPATTNTNLYLRMGTGGGPTWDAGAFYGSAAFRWTHAASAVSGAASGLTFIGLDGSGGVKSDAVLTFSGTFRLFHPQSTAANKRVNGQSGYVDNAGVILGCTFSGLYLSVTAVTGIRFLMSAGNITSGTIRAYGVVK